MFSLKSLGLALVALTCVSFALSPLAFFEGLNLELGLENDDSINHCIARMLTGSEEQSTVCLDAFDSYLVALHESTFEADQGQTVEEVAIEGVGAVFRALDKIEQEENFAAGQEVAQILRQFALASRKISHERRLGDANITVNVTELLLGLNNQLAIANQTQLTDCLSESNQADIVIQALVVALEQKNVLESISDFIKLAKFLPGFKATCTTSIQGLEVWAKPIEKALFANATDFFNTINANLQRNPFLVASQTIAVTQDLKSGRDYAAGVTSGKLVQEALKGIIN